MLTEHCIRAVIFDKYRVSHWIAAVNAYFRTVNARAPTVLYLFTDDVQIFFPKFGFAHGKAVLVRFSELMTSQLESIGHDIESFILKTAER